MYHVIREWWMTVEWTNKEWKIKIKNKWIKNVSFSMDRLVMVNARCNELFSMDRL